MVDWASKETTSPRRRLFELTFKMRNARLGGNAVSRHRIESCVEIRQIFLSEPVSRAQQKKELSAWSRLLTINLSANGEYFQHRAKCRRMGGVLSGPQIWLSRSKYRI